MAVWQHSVVCMYGVLCGDVSWTAYSLSQEVKDRTLLDSKCTKSNLHLHIERHTYTPHGKHLRN